MSENKKDDNWGCLWIALGLVGIYFMGILVKGAARFVVTTDGVLGFILFCLGVYLFIRFVNKNDNQ